MNLEIVQLTLSLLHYLHLSFMQFFLICFYKVLQFEEEGWQSVKLHTVIWWSLLTVTLQFWHPLSSSYTEGLFWCRNCLLFLLVSNYLMSRSWERGHYTAVTVLNCSRFFCLYVACMEEKAMAPHSSTLAWKIPWMEEPAGLQSMRSLRVGHDWVTSLSRIGEGNGNPLQCACLENPRDGGAWWASVYGVAQSRTRLKWLSSSLCICVPLDKFF